jgi:hypothetical protein
MERISDTPVVIQIDPSDVCAAAGRSGPKTEGEATMMDTNTQAGRMKAIVDWKLQHEVEYTTGSIIKRARTLAQRLTRLADGLEADPEYSFNTIGELQGNGVELDAMCMKLGFARDTLKLFRQAIAAVEEDAKE